MAAHLVGPSLVAAAEEPLAFWLCILLITVLGMLLTLLDDTGASKNDSSCHFGNPSLHLLDTSATMLISPLLADQMSLGLLEPLWSLFEPDGALSTLLFKCSARAKANSAYSLLSNGCSLARTIVVKLGSPCCPSRGGAKKNILPSEQIRMTFWMELDAYWGYFQLFVMGLVREYILRAMAFFLRDPMALAYFAKERWSSGWVEFYLQHMYKLYGDCFNRPIASAPDSCIEVVRRERPGGIIFGPLHEFSHTDQVHTCVNLGSYNYLGFGGVDEFCTPVVRAVAMKHGFSAAGTRTEGGTMPVHRELEAEMARFLDKDDAIVLGMGFATNSTIIPALFEIKAGGQGILVLSDSLNHRSIVEGVRLSGVTVRPFAHNAMDSLEAELKRATSCTATNGQPWRKIFIVVEGIYSMEGDFCRLREIVALKKKYGAYLYLDEAHSIGAVGATGRGVTELFGIPREEVDVMMGTFTKSFGSAGGYVASSRGVIDALRRNALGSIFGAAMSPPCAAQALAALRVISGFEGGTTGSEKLAQIRANSNFFRAELQRKGFKILGDTDSPIIPVMLHHPKKMAKFSRMCLEKGIAVVVVGYPAVPVLYERVRFCISASHTRAQLESVISQVGEIGAAVGVLYERGTSQAEVAARQAQQKAYTVALHKAPLELPNGFAEEAGGRWYPEPLAPEVHGQANTLATAALDAVTKAEERTARDLRLFDPLGYAKEPIDAVKCAIGTTMDVFGFGSCGPRGFYGTTTPHFELELKLQEFLGVEAAILYPAGVATASSVLPALIQSGDSIIVDAEVHLGIRAGLRLCRAEMQWVPHNDIPALEAALAASAAVDAQKQGAKRQRRTFVIVEALCQRTGRIAPLPEVVALKEKYGAQLILDESFSLGTLGATGRGLCEMCGIDMARVDAIVGSLEHAVAGLGGFCGGRRTLVNHQRLAGAAYCFSASCPPSACSAAAAVLADIAGEGGRTRLTCLRANAAMLHKALREATSVCGGSLELASDPESYVQHLRWSGDAEEGKRRLSAVAESCANSDGVRLQICSADLCSAEGAFGDRLKAPPTPAPSLRACASVHLTQADIDAVGTALEAALKAL